MRKKKKAQVKDFLVEVRGRADEGYSTRQLMSSLIPDIGTELKVAASEVTAALQDDQVAFRGQPHGNALKSMECIEIRGNPLKTIEIH